MSWDSKGEAYFLQVVERKDVDPDHTPKIAGILKLCGMPAFLFYALYTMYTAVYVSRKYKYYFEQIERMKKKKVMRWLKKADKAIFGTGPIRASETPPMFQKTKKNRKGYVSDSDYSRI